MIRIVIFCICILKHAGCTLFPAQFTGDTTMTQPHRRSNTAVGPRFFLHHFRQHWRAWRQRVQARKALRRLNNDRLEDMGLTRRDVDNLW
ncbi:DUF1127 domain-containing protein [Dickeya sp. NCPPB 3274]